MIKIRLSRNILKGKPFYRIVAVDVRRKRGGKPLDIIGFWNPSHKSKTIDKSKLSSWIKKGAKITSAVEKLVTGQK